MEWDVATSTSLAVSFLQNYLHILFTNTTFLLAPDEVIEAPLRKYYALGISDVEVTTLLQGHYDTEKYGLRFVLTHCLSLFSTCISVVTVRRLRKKWNILSTRQQKHTVESIYEEVYNMRKRFPLRGVEGIRKALRKEHGIRASR